jgi:hypothetical protein
VLVANALALRWRLAVDFAFDGEQGIDAFDRFDRDRRLVDPRQVEELAPRMRPETGKVRPWAWVTLRISLLDTVAGSIRKIWAHFSGST